VTCFAHAAVLLKVLSDDDVTGATSRAMRRLTEWTVGGGSRPTRHHRGMNGVSLTAAKQHVEI